MLKKRGKKVKEIEKPILPITSLFIWDAFLELTTERHELGPIPWSSIDRFARRYRITDNAEFDSLCFFIRGLDNEYRNIRQKEIERNRNLNKPKKNNRRGR